MVYAGNDLLNIVLRKVYAAERDDFKGSGNASGLNYTFDVIAPPTGRFIVGAATHNLEIDLVVDIQTTGILTFHDHVALRAIGKLVLSGRILSLTSLKVQPASGGNPLAAAVAVAVNKQIIPSISDELDNTRVPQLTELFGTNLAANPKTGTAINGPALEVGASIAGKSGIAAADPPNATNIAALSSGSASTALVIAMVSSAAVNVLAKALIPALSYKFDKRANGGGFGAGIKGTIKATQPILKVTAGNGTVKTKISFSGLQGGIKAPVVGWKWMSLSVPQFEVTIQHTLKAVGSKGVITLTGISKIKVSLSWPAMLSPVKNLAEDLLEKVAALFEKKIEDAIEGKQFVLFRLPSQIPGTDLDANLSFAPSGGLKYFGSTVQALVQIQA